MMNPDPSLTITGTMIKEGELRARVQHAVLPAKYNDPVSNGFRHK